MTLEEGPSAVPTRSIPRLAGSLLFISLALAGVAGGQILTPSIPGSPSLPPPSLDPLALAPHYDVHTLTLQLLDPIPSADPSSAEVLIEIQVGAELWTLALEPYSLRADGFRVLVDDGSGNLVPHPEPPVATRRGSVLEVPGSQVRATLEGDRLRALIITPQGNWAVQPVSEVGLVAREPWHVVFAAADSLPLPYVCGNRDVHSQGAAGGGPMPFGTVFHVAEIAVDADFEFYSLNGSSVASTVNDVEAVLNAVEGVYDNSPILIAYELSTVVVRTSSADPYGTQSSPSGLLGSFDTVWTATPENAIQRDVAHLFTGVNLNGSVIGIANLSDICTSNAYGLSQSRFTTNFNSRVALTAHELGHNWSATHCDSQADCRIMCSGLGGCDGLSPLTFAPVPQDQIVDYRDTRSCLGDRPPAAGLPFFEDFAGSGLAPDRWTYNNGGSVSTQGISEPSSPNSFVLDATGPGTFEDDELRSNRMLLGGTADPYLRVFTQHRGVEAGEELVVEYLTVALDWVELERIVSNGIDQTTFEDSTYDLPANARHNGFRVRFRTEVNEANDDWFIDDVLVTEGPPPPLDPPEIVSIVPSSGPTAGGTFITITGIDLSSDVVVLIGGQPLTGVIYVGMNELRGFTPAVANPGPVVVIASQTSGSDILDPGYVYTQEDLRLADTFGAPGGLASAPVIADHETPLAGYSVSVEFPANLLQVVEVTSAGTDAAGAEFFVPNWDNTVAPGGGWWTLGVVMSFSGGITLLPSAATTLANVTYAVSGSAAIGTEIPVTPVSGAGFPTTDNIFVGSLGVALTPTLFGGRITIAGNLFSRGDANRDGAVNIGDAVAMLDYLFSSGPAPCLDAVDANDDGTANIADPIGLLSYLFSGGEALPEPFPGAGIDPTADSLDCQG